VHQCESGKRLRKKAKNRPAKQAPCNVVESEAVEEFPQQMRGVDPLLTVASVATAASTPDQTQSVITHAPLGPFFQPMVSFVWMVPANGVFVCPVPSLDAHGQSIVEGVPAKLQSNLSLSQDRDRAISDVSTQASDSGSELQIQ